MKKIVFVLIYCYVSILYNVHARISWVAPDSVGRAVAVNEAMWGVWREKCKSLAKSGKSAEQVNNEALAYVNKILLSLFNKIMLEIPESYRYAINGTVFQANRDWGLSDEEVFHFSTVQELVSAIDGGYRQVCYELEKILYAHPQHIDYLHQMFLAELGEDEPIYPEKTEFDLIDLVRLTITIHEAQAAAQLIRIEIAKDFDFDQNKAWEMGLIAWREWQRLYWELQQQIPIGILAPICDKWLVVDIHWDMVHVPFGSTSVLAAVMKGLGDEYLHEDQKFLEKPINIKDEQEDLVSIFAMLHV